MCYKLYANISELYSQNKIIVKQNHIKENIKCLRKNLALSQGEFGALFNVTRDNIASYERGTEPKLNFITSIVNYFHISYDDFINIKIDESFFNTKSIENVTNLDSNTNSNILRNKRKVQKTLLYDDYLTSIPNINRFSQVSDVEGKYEAPILLEEPGTGVPYYDVDFCAGFDLVFNDQTTVPAGYVNIPQYRNAESLANITGHSMEPLISNGDIIALKKLEDWRTYLLYGEIYGVMTDEYRTVKKVRRGHDIDHVILEPINKAEFEETEIPKSIITGVWTVLGCIKKLF